MESYWPTVIQHTIRNCNGEPLPECPEVKRLVEVRSRHNLAKVVNMTVNVH